MNIYFLSRQQTSDYLQLDADGFVGSLTQADLKARKCSSHYEYLTCAMKSADDFTEEEKLILIRLCKQADAYVPQCTLPWIFAKAHYEDGLPHTRGAVIFLSKVCDARTVVHERVHVWQKTRGDAQYPGYMLMAGSDELMRSNPDTDKRIWTRNGKACGKFYNSKNPTGISDCYQFERHPFEEEAYSIAGKCL
jgi:hypothetical protein